MGVAWLLLCGISHALPVALIIWAFKWFIDSSKDERRPLAQTVGYGLFVSGCVLMALLIMASPAMTMVYYDEACWYLYTLIATPWLTHAFVLGGENAMGGLDYVKAIQVQGVPSMVGNWCLRLHLIFALGWVIGMPMQFFWTLRHDNKFVHRITGRLALTCSLGTAVTAIIQPHLPAGELHYQINASFTMRNDDPDTVPTWMVWTPIALWTIFCACKAFYHAYRREIPQHRMWVVRNITGGLTVGIMRAMVVWWIQFVFPTASTGNGVLPIFPILIVLALAVAVGVIEVYIRCYTNNGEALEPLQQEVLNLPGKGRPEPCVFFMILSVYGLAATMYNNFLSTDLRQKLVPSLANPLILFELFMNFYNDTFISPTTASGGLDLFLLLAPMLLFCTIEARRLHLRFLWLHVIMGYISAIAFSVPFFLWRRAMTLLTSQKENTGDGGEGWCAPVVAFAVINFVATLFVYSTKGELNLPTTVGWYFVLPIILYLPSCVAPSAPITTHLPRWANMFLKLYAIAAFFASAYGKLMAAGAILDGSAIERPAGRSIMWNVIVTTTAAIAIILLETPMLSAGKRASLVLFTAIAPGSGFSYFLAMHEAGTDAVAEGYRSL